MEHNYSIDSVTLNVNNLDGMTKFYEETIGLEVLNRNEVRSELGGLGSTAPILTLLKSEAKQRKQNTGLYHFAVLLDSRKALGSFLIHLLATGYPIDGASDHGYSEAIYLTDPEGNGIEVYADKEVSAWDIEDDGTINGITIAMDAEGVLKSGEQNVPKMNENTIMGHVHLFVTDLVATEKFYVDQLGFDLKLNYGDQAKFMASGLYHHHVGANTWAGTHLQKPVEGDLGIHHFTIKTPNDLTELYMELSTTGIDITNNGSYLSLVDNSGIAIRIVNPQ
ncbi:MAG: VOC family protein [Erysipelothrix sp.]|nr:VOC family protein [Erysipelothrix sp.]